MRRYHSFPNGALGRNMSKPNSAVRVEVSNPENHVLKHQFLGCQSLTDSHTLFLSDRNTIQDAKYKKIPRSFRFATLAILGCYSMQNATFGLAKWVIPKISLLIIIWLVVWNIFYFSIYWESSSRLTFIFFRKVETTNQIYISIHVMDIISNPQIPSMSIRGDCYYPQKWV